MSSTAPATFNTLDLMIAGFLAKFDSEATRIAYEMDLDIWRGWCDKNNLDVLTVQRAHIEFFARHLQTDRNNGKATVNRRLVCLRSFYKTLAQDRIIEHSPAENVRLPKVSRDRSQYTMISRGELSSMLKYAEKSSPTDSALLCMMGLLGLRVSEVCSLDVDSADRYEMGHRMMDFIGKGGKSISIPLPPSIARKFDAARDGRAYGPLLLRRNDTRMNRRSADRVVKRIALKSGIDKRVSPHDLRAAAITLALESGVSLRDVQRGIGRHSDARQTEWYDRSLMNLDRHPAYQMTSYIVA